MAQRDSSRPLAPAGTRSRCAYTVRAGLVGLALLSACEPGPALELELDQSAASAEELDELLERVEQLEAEQAAQASRLAEAEAALGECLTTAEQAEANAAAAQERAAELRAELDDGALWDRLQRLEEDLGILWTAVEALYE